ncbi:pirin family protein [Neisseriaceae bacterium B1]
MRNVKQIYRANSQHWVGDGFLVQPLFSHMGEDKHTTPFLMLDYAAPKKFEPNQGYPHGVGQHPHKGFETVTIACMGEVAHRDSAGGGGVIGEGDVQWMTAGAGIIHEEFHSEAFSRAGGMFEMVQLWVNLPAKYKNVPPRYQHLAKENIAVVERDGATIRLIAGDLDGKQGAAETYTAMNVWEIALPQGKSLNLDIPETHNLMMVVLRGHVEFNQQDKATPGEFITFEQASGSLNIVAHDEDAKLLLLSGEPIDEPVVGYGPFVMNTKEEIRQAIADFNSGKFGAID